MAMGLDGDAPVLSIGIRTITHNRSGLKLYPHEVIVIEMTEGSEVSAFDLTPSLARMYSDRLKEFADKIDAKKGVSETTIRKVNLDAPH